MSETLNDESVLLLAQVAAGLNGGRFAARVNDEAIKREAMALVTPAREARRRVNARKRQASRAERVAAERAQRAEWLRSWQDYSPANAARVDEVFAIFQRAPKRSLVRDIARVILAGRIHVSTCNGAECDGCRTIPKDWRATVRAYRDARRELAIMGNFQLSRMDMSPDAGSRFYRSVLTHWHNYAGGRHAAIHGVTADDVFQDAMIAAIENGDTLDGVPTFGPMYMHTRRATESAVFTYRRQHDSTPPYSTWTWADWSDWAHQNGADHDARVFSTLAEWQAYDAAKAAHTAAEESARLIAEDRAAHLTYVSQARSALASLILGGMTVRRVANLLGRSVESMASGLESELYA